MYIQYLKERWGHISAQLIHSFRVFCGGSGQPVLVTPSRYRKGKIVAAASVVFMLAGGIIGVYGHVELQNELDKAASHQQQLDAMKRDTAALQKKMDKFDALDQEMRQMVKGAGTGESPKGDGGVIDQQKKSPDFSNANYNDLLYTASRMETKVNARVISFVTLKTVLSDTAGEQVRQMQQDHKQYESSTYPSIWPVNGPITSPFGNRRMGGSVEFHPGVDIAVDYGTPVRATASGTVSIAGWCGGYGNLVEIDHGNGFVTRYGHNSMLLVVQGQAVKTGDIISLAGSTGYSTGPHVHYEVRVNGTPTDPMLFLP